MDEVKLIELMCVCRRVVIKGPGTKANQAWFTVICYLTAGGKVKICGPDLADTLDACYLMCTD